MDNSRGDCGLRPDGMALTAAVTAVVSNSVVVSGLVMVNRYFRSARAAAPVINTARAPKHSEQPSKFGYAARPRSERIAGRDASSKHDLISTLLCPPKRASRRR